MYIFNSRVRMQRLSARKSQDVKGQIDTNRRKNNAGNCYWTGFLSRWIDQISSWSCHCWCVAAGRSSVGERRHYDAVALLDIPVLAFRAHVVHEPRVDVKQIPPNKQRDRGETLHKVELVAISTNTTTARAKQATEAENW